MGHRRSVRQAAGRVRHRDNLPECRGAEPDPCSKHDHIRSQLASGGRRRGSSSAYGLVGSDPHARETWTRTTWEMSGMAHTCA